MKLVAERPHRQYGSAIYVKTDSVIEATSIKEANNIEVLTVELSNVVVSSIYKPPAVDFKFPDNIPRVQGKPQIIIGDFNSHSTQWGYRETNKDGEAVEEWMDTNQLSLIHNPKLPSSLQSARWKRGYNPDLIAVTNNIAGQCQKIVLDPIPASQHRPIGVQVSAVVKPTRVPFKRRFNYKKANWKDFSEELDNKVRQFTPIASNYDLFAKLVNKTARRHIPRGCKEHYIPGLCKESSKLYDDYVAKYEQDPFSEETTELGERVMDCIYHERQKTWQTMIEATDMAKNSKKAWATIRKLRGDPKAPPQQPKVTANQVANQLLLNGKTVKKKPKKLNRKKYSQNHGHTKPLTMEELEKGISSLKLGKAIGLDNIATEQITHFGPITRKWLLQLYNQCLSTHRLPKTWKKAHILALLKPGKDPSVAKSYRPISLLSHLYKLFERLLLNRIGPIIDDLLIDEQAGFRPGKSTTSQVLNLTQYIEDGFEEGKVTGAVFVDLSAAYDTVNHRSLLHKILEITKDINLTELIESMLANRYFFVELGGKKSRWRKLKNGLPQGSVLAPLLFNIYTNDQPKTEGTRRFIYADDLGVAAQDKEFSVVENALSKALNDLTPYYKENHLRANPAKTQVCAFHLRNHEAKRQLSINWSGTQLENCVHPVYLGVTLDRSLTYKTHIQKTRAKVSARNNIVSKLTGTRWGANPHTLRSTALALCYSTAEYACPVWERSAHAKKIDPVINSTCRLITGCLRSTPVDCLYSLSGIAPPDIRRSATSSKERFRQSNDSRHPMFGYKPAKSRLKSRNSFLSKVNPKAKAEAARSELWRERLVNAPPRITMCLPVKEELPPGNNDTWVNWKCLNRLRAGTGRCKSNLKKWGCLKSPDDVCDCGTESQTMSHVLRCPQLDQECRKEDLAEYNDVAKRCVAHWARENI
jgi:hypothetical protein